MRNEDFFEVIGKITVLFSTVDLLATELILKIKVLETEELKLPHETANLGTKIGYLEKLTVLNPVAKASLNHIHENLPFISTVANGRNRYMHDQWVFRPESICSGKIDRIRLTSSGLKETTSLTYDDLIKFCSEVETLQGIFFNAMVKAGVEIA